MAIAEAEVLDEHRFAGGRLTIDLAALARNWQTLDRHSRGAVTAAVVKSDAYGIGLEPAARALSRAGCTTFFVALPVEGIRLREALPNATIYVLNGLLEGGTEIYAAANLRPALSSLPEVEEWAAYRRNGGRLEAALHVDTGMNRLGLSMGEVERYLREYDHEALGITLVMTHLTCADMPDHADNADQLELIREIRDHFPRVPLSAANSAGVFLGADFHFDLVRPGIALYGGAAVTGIANPMEPVVTLEARILQVRAAAHTETVGYGSVESLGRPSMLAIASIGYADGYPRHASSSDEKSGGRAWINERSAPIVGRVSMDLIALDVTDIPGTRRGDWAELFGPNVPIHEVADHAGTIDYELLTRLSVGSRHHRTYRGD
ncbi:alanine racemase [Bauldia sp.]|uniref:alanine racemase n=1 Tax=Bauldia sp. TaxID=2575872 RepID=UPI003BAD7650